MWGTLIFIYVVIILAAVAMIAWYLFMKRRTKNRMYELEQRWRKELHSKGLSQVDIERIVEQRKQTYVLQHPYSRIFWPRE